MPTTPPKEYNALEEEQGFGDCFFHFSLLLSVRDGKTPLTEAQDLIKKHELMKEVATGTVKTIATPDVYEEEPSEFRQALHRRRLLRCACAHSIDRFERSLGPSVAMGQVQDHRYSMARYSTLIDGLAWTPTNFYPRKCSRTTSQPGRYPLCHHTCSKETPANSRR